MENNPDHTENMVALRRIEGQVRGLQKMIENRNYCMDIINQIYAVKGALSRVEENILERHLENCMAKAVLGSSDKEKKQKLDEIIKLIRQTRKA